MHTAKKRGVAKRIPRRKELTPNVPPPAAFVEEKPNEDELLAEMLAHTMVSDGELMIALRSKNPDKRQAACKAFAVEFVAELKSALKSEAIKSGLDGKFYGLLWRRRDDGSEGQDFVAFVPRDKMLLAMLAHYKFLCSEAGCSARQVSAVHRLLERAAAWRESHSHLMKTADVEVGEEVS